MNVHPPETPSNGEHSVSSAPTHDLNVCLVVSGPNTGGGMERHVSDLANGLADRHGVHVLAHDSYRQLFGSSVNFRDVGFTSWRFDVLFLWQFLREIRDIRPTIVHAHGRKAGQVIALTRRFFDAPCILTVHNLSRDPLLYSRFDSVIAVSSLVAQGIEHSRLYTVYNGC